MKLVSNVIQLDGPELLESEASDENNGHTAGEVLKAAFYWNEWSLSRKSIF